MRPTIALAAWLCCDETRLCWTVNSWLSFWICVYVAVWEGALKNYGPNMGYDYGGRLLAAWLDR